VFEYVDPGGIPCTVIVSLRGFTTIRAIRPAGAIILHRRGYEGGASMASIGAGTLECPGQAGEAYGNGEAAFGLGDRAAAENWLRQATSVCPGHSLAWDELGVILQVSNRIEEARAAYETAVAKDPRSARALTHLAGLAIQESRHTAALELCERAIRLKPMDLPRLWLYYGLEGYRAGQFKAAEERLSRAIEEDPMRLFPLAEFLLGMTMAREGEMAGASAHLRAYLGVPSRQIGRAKCLRRPLRRNCESCWDFGVAAALQPCVRILGDKNGLSGSRTPAANRNFDLLSPIRKSAEKR